MYLKIGNEIKLLIILLVLVCEFSFAQKNNNSNLAFRDTTSREVIQEKIEIARNQFSSDSIIPVELMEEILAVSIGQNYLKETADAYFLLSEMNKASEQCEHAIKNVKKSQEIYLSLNDNDGYFNTVLLVSDCYITQKNYELAEQQYTTAILRFSTSDLQKKLALKLELGRLYLINNYSKAKPIFEEILPQALNNKFYAIASETEIELGNIALKEQNYSRAESFFKSAKEHATLSENPVLVYNANNQLTSCFVSNNDMTNANLTLNDATTYMWTTGDTNLILSTNLAVADYNVTIGNYTNAIDVLNSTYILSGATSNLDFQTSSAEKLYSIYALTNDGSRVADAYNSYITLKDSLLNQKKIKKLTNQNALNTVQNEVDVLERQRELDKQTIDLLERESAVNQSEIANQRILLYILGILLLVFAGVGIYVHRNNKAKKKATQLLYLKSLRSQMNPHFIFNSLNSVNAFISQNNEREANKYLARFAKLMRQILDQSESEFISLAQEIEILQLYVQLENDRFKDAFNYTITIDESIDQDLYQIPPMLVQPFVENAIWHGLRYKNEGGQLTIRFINRHTFLEIKIVDNGIGRLASERLKTKNQKEHKSAATSIVENRVKTINELFQTNIQFEIEDLPHESGTEVRINVYPKSQK